MTKGKKGDIIVIAKFYFTKGYIKMIFGNIKTFRSCGLGSEALDKYIEVLKTITLDTPLGRHELSDGAYYNVCEVNTQKPISEGVFETHKKYIDIQYVYDGTEVIGYADIDTLKVTKEYDAEGDYALHEGEGVFFTLKPGDFAVFAPMDAHMPGCGDGKSKKVIIKVPVK